MATPSSDVYALGVTTDEMLNGCLPFDSASGEDARGTLPGVLRRGSWMSRAPQADGASFVLVDGSFRRPGSAIAIEPLDADASGVRR